MNVDGWVVDAFSVSDRHDLGTLSCERMRRVLYALLMHKCEWLSGNRMAISLMCKP